MALATYSDLKTSVATWLSRADLTTNIPDFIRLCHAQLMRELRGHPRLIKRMDSFPITGEYTAAPADFMEFVSGYVAGGQALQYLPDDLQTGQNYAAGFTANTSATPQYFSISGGGATDIQFRFSPVPGATTATIQYYARLPFFTSDADYNWILTNDPDLYLYGSLLQAVAFIQDDPRIGLWQSAYLAALGSLKGEGSRVRSGNGMAIRAA